MAQGVPLRLDGQRFGRLIVLGRGRPRHWRCRCDCGQEREVYSSRLVGGQTVSCGCYAADKVRERSRRHGDTGSKEWLAWKSMLERCANPKHLFWHRYGGRGIRVCARWQRYEDFLADMGRAPSGDHSLERTDNERGYEPENCRWATRAEQALNRSDLHLLTHGGETYSISEWARRRAFPAYVLWNRLRAGWPVEKCLEEPWSPRLRRG